MNNTLLRVGRLADALRSHIQRASGLPLVDLSVIKIVVGDPERRAGGK
jgi:hypothetical protein